MLGEFEKAFFHYRESGCADFEELDLAEFLALQNELKQLLNSYLEISLDEDYYQD
jgi:hypothetical protein